MLLLSMSCCFFLLSHFNVFCYWCMFVLLDVNINVHVMCLVMLMFMLCFYLCVDFSNACVVEFYLYCLLFVNFSCWKCVENRKFRTSKLSSLFIFWYELFWCSFSNILFYFLFLCIVLACHVIILLSSFF